jgi:hypothetical protein
VEDTEAPPEDVPPERMVLMGLKHHKWWRKMGEMSKMASLSKKKIRIHQTRLSFIHDETENVKSISLTFQGPDVLNLAG